jgi:hypothetical protein
MNYEEIINNAVNMVIGEAGYGVNQHEQVLTHRLAFYLEGSGNFSDHVIDCEYFSHIAGRKIDDNGTPFRPDIVIHRRNNDGNNLIMIEAKKGRVSERRIETLKNQIRQRSSYGYIHYFIVIFPNIGESGEVIEVNI